MVLENWKETAACHQGNGVPEVEAFEAWCSWFWAIEGHRSWSLWRGQC